MVRLALFLLICYLTYAFYKMAQKPQQEPKIKNLGKARVVSGSSCPAPKTFLDYIKGKVGPGQKERIRNHVDRCEDCQQALQAVFEVSTDDGLKKQEHQEKG